MYHLVSRHHGKHDRRQLPCHLCLFIRITFESNPRASSRALVGFAAHVPACVRVMAGSGWLLERYLLLVLLMLSVIYQRLIFRLQSLHSVWVPPAASFTDASTDVHRLRFSVARREGCYKIRNGRTLFVIWLSHFLVFLKTTLLQMVSVVVVLWVSVSQCS